MPSVMQDLSARKREVRELRKHLKDLTGTVEAFLRLLDAEMKQPSNPERGRRIADLSNKLDMANQLARRFGLGIGAPRKPNAPRQPVIAGAERTEDKDGK